MIRINIILMCWGVLFNVQQKKDAFENLNCHRIHLELPLDSSSGIEIKTTRMALAKIFSFSNTLRLPIT